MLIHFQESKGARAWRVLLGRIAEARRRWRSFGRWTLREALQARAARLWCRLFGHSGKHVQKMWCSLCARCSAVVEEKPRQAVLQARREVNSDATTYAVAPSSKELATLDEMMAKMRGLIHQHRGHPERTRYVEAELERAATLRAVLVPLPPMLVERSDFIGPDDWVTIDGQNVLGRFAWFRLMRLTGAPWSEEALTPDQDYPRDSPP